MPIVKEQRMKAINTLAVQPDKLSSRHEIVALLDIGGATGKQISEATNYTEGYISIIRNTPMYQEMKEKKKLELHAQTIDKQSTALATGDPVENALKELAMSAVTKYKDLMQADSEHVQKSVADSILDRTGYKPHTASTKLSVEVTEKMADRFERALNLGDTNEPTDNVRKTTLSITKEVPE